MALAQGGIESALTRISPNLDSASRTLGKMLGTLIFVILPVIWPALLMAGLLVFIDAIKELSATMILQPVGLETLSMRIFNHASAGNVERTGPGSLIMIALALIPTFILAYGVGTTSKGQIESQIGSGFRSSFEAHLKRGRFPVQSLWSCADRLAGHRRIWRIKMPLSCRAVSMALRRSSVPKSIKIKLV